MEMTQRTPLYLAMITVSSAIASISFIWVGILGFGVCALFVESVGYWWNR